MITFDDTIATYCSKFIAENGQQPEMAPPGLETYRGARGDGTGKKNPAGQSQMHPNALKCIIHEIQYNSIIFNPYWLKFHEIVLYMSYFEAAQAACPPRWGAPLQASHADWDWENWKDPNAGWGGPNAGDRDLEFTNGMEWILPGQYGQTGDEYPDISRFYVESF